MKMNNSNKLESEIWNRVFTIKMEKLKSKQKHKEIEKFQVYFQPSFLSQYLI